MITNMNENGDTRIEKDALGEVRVPRDRYYGAQTQRAVENFAIGCERFPAEFVRAHAIVKKAAAIVNARMGALDATLSTAIQSAADEVIAGKWDDHFPLTIWQSGSGTQTNMNINEVIANRAGELLGGELGRKDPVHPNDHVNMSQSTNDTIPTSMHISAVTGVCEGLLPALDRLAAVFEEKARDFKDIVKTGRTHLQDATPITLGQEFSGYAVQLRQARAGIDATLAELRQLPIGGTAVGTGLNTAVGYDEAMVREISRIAGHEFTPAASKFAALAAHDAAVRTSGALKALAMALMKIANDIRWLGSGPRCGLGELVLPANEPGSSIMPGKVNPTQCEVVAMVACQVFANDAALAMAGSQGNFELNVYKPLMAHALLQSIRLLSEVCLSFAERCVVGIEPDRKRMAEHVSNSLMLVTALNARIGYDKAAEIALTAWREGLTLKESALRLGYVTEAEYDEWVDPSKMIGPAD